MKRRIFLMHDEGRLRELVEEGFASEDSLQALLADHPSLLAGDQMDEDSPRRWLLVCREAGVPDRKDGSDRWSLDHLFLDQEGDPTLVEVKRSSDTRIRREVLGQMLDYAANSLAFWPVERLQALYEAECERRGEDPEERLRELLDGEAVDSDAFWQQVKTNLQAGRIRMVFVADEIPTELRRVVEFLNQQMDPAEVLAVAIRQYVGDDLRTLVPQVIGQTAEAQDRKGVGSRAKRQWDESSFFATLAKRGDEDTTEGARQLYRWAQQELPRITWGQGGRWGSCIPGRDVDGVAHSPIALWTYGSVEIRFWHMSTKPPFDDDSRRQELLERLNRVPGVSLPPDAYSRAPALPLSVLAKEEGWAAFRGVLTWYLGQIGVAEEPAPRPTGRNPRD